MRKELVWGVVGATIAVVGAVVIRGPAEAQAPPSGGWSAVTTTGAAWRINSRTCDLQYCAVVGASPEFRVACISAPSANGVK